MLTAEDAPTQAEQRALQALILKRNMEEAAESLCISPYTLNRHLDRLRRRYGFWTTVQLATWAVRLGYVEAAERSVLVPIRRSMQPARPVRYRPRRAAVLNEPDGRIPVTA
jgi:DNA-binding CsgD family transcriptional regulator